MTTLPSATCTLAAPTLRPAPNPAIGIFWQSGAAVFGFLLLVVILV